MADLEGVWSLGVHDEMAATDRLADDVRRLRGLLARALPHIDPNDSDDAYFLVHAIKEATR